MKQPEPKPPETEKPQRIRKPKLGLRFEEKRREDSKPD